MSSQAPKLTLWRVITRTSSRKDEEAKWTVADQREVLLVHEAIIEALFEIGYLVRILPLPETDGLIQEWILWASTEEEALNIVEGMPLADAQLMKISLSPEKYEPKPPAPGNIMERILSGMSAKESIRLMVEEDLSDMENILLGYRAYLREKNLILGDNSPLTWENSSGIWEKTVNQVNLIRQEKEAISKADDLDRRVQAKRALLEEFGIDPDKIDERDKFNE